MHEPRPLFRHSDLFSEPCDPLVEAFARLSGYEEHLGQRIEALDSLYECLVVEVEESTGIYLVYGDRLSHGVHQRVLERLVVALRKRQDLDVDSRSDILLRCADEVAYVLEEHDVEI